MPFSTKYCAAQHAFGPVLHCKIAWLGFIAR